MSSVRSASGRKKPERVIKASSDDEQNKTDRRIS